jgi:hypothetical protein
MSLTRDEYRDLTREFLTKSLETTTNKTKVIQESKKSFLNEGTLMSAEESLTIALDEYVDAIESNSSPGALPSLHDVKSIIYDFLEGYFEVHDSPLQDEIHAWASQSKKI